MAGLNFDYGFDDDDENEDPQNECDSPLDNYNYYDHTPTRSKPRYPMPHAKRRRPGTFDPYVTPPPHTPGPSFIPHTGGHSWFESTDSKINTLIESQNKIMGMFGDVMKQVGDANQRLGDVEQVIKNFASSSSSPEEKKRIPTGISLSKKNQV